MPSGSGIRKMVPLNGVLFLNCSMRHPVRQSRTAPNDDRTDTAGNRETRADYVRGRAIVQAEDGLALQRFSAARNGGHERNGRNGHKGEASLCVGVLCVDWTRAIAGMS